MNFTKFFGDFHIARIYETVAKRFHLSHWHRTVDDKLKTLDNLYQMLATDRNTRWMFILEIAIVLLFIIDVGILLKTMHWLGGVRFETASNTNTDENNQRS
jgi:uncharacterized Rmd1/YagE family protein